MTRTTKIIIVALAALIVALMLFIIIDKQSGAILFEEIIIADFPIVCDDFAFSNFVIVAGSGWLFVADNRVFLLLSDKTITDVSMRFLQGNNELICFYKEFITPEVSHFSSTQTLIKNTDFTILKPLSVEIAYKKNGIAQNYSQEIVIGNYSKYIVHNRNVDE